MILIQYGEKNPSGTVDGGGEWICTIFQQCTLTIFIKSLYKIFIPLIQKYFLEFTFSKKDRCRDIWTKMISKFSKRMPISERYSANIMYMIYDCIWKLSKRWIFKLIPKYIASNMNSVFRNMTGLFFLHFWRFMGIDRNVGKYKK